MNVEVAVDETRIQSIRISNLDESVAAMYPLLQPAIEEIAQQICDTQSLENIELPSDTPYTSQLLLNAIDEALKCKETGAQKNIVFGLTGTGYFDMVAYGKYNDGDMVDYLPSDEDIAKALAQLPKV